MPLRLPPRLLLLAALLSPAARAAPAPADLPGVTADEALARLADGNARYRRGTPERPSQDPGRRADLAGGQHPFAIVLSCSDSRVPPEIVFDQGLGDLFVIRVAGNTAGVDETAAVDYGAEHLGAPLCVVLGHSNCGAVKAAVAGAQLPGSLGEVMAAIAPAVAAARRAHPDLTGDALLAAAVEANVWHSIETLFARSEIVRHLVAAGRLRVVGAVYDLPSGDVRWLGPHPEQQRLLAAPAVAPH